jgi:prepilin-type N-terminal cleavage/methylation domain-containing protein
MSTENRRKSSIKNRLGGGAANKGFSLVELIIVIAIMAALIAILAPQFVKYIERSRVAADDATAEELLNTVQVIMADEKYAPVIAKGNGNNTFSTPIKFTHKDAPNWTSGNNTVTVNDAHLTASTSAGTPTTQAAAIRAGLTEFLGPDWPIKYNVKSNTRAGQTYTVTLTYKDAVGGVSGEYTVSGAWAATK